MKLLPIFHYFIWSIRHHFKIYKIYIYSCLSYATTFRTHFILVIIMDLFFYVSSLLTVDFIYRWVDKIGHWNRDEFLFFLTFMLAAEQIHVTILSRNFWELSVAIKRGNLDFILIRPVNSIFASFFRYIRPIGYIAISYTLIVCYYFGVKINLSGFSLFLIPFMLIVSVAFLGAIEILLSCGMFWLVEGHGINFLRMQLQSVSRWPEFIFQKTLRLVFLYFIPVLLVGNAPVRFLMNPVQDYLPLLKLFGIFILLIFLIRYFWSAGLDRYESASS